MSINLGVPDDIEPQLKPRITVIGVGGAGGNAVNNMIESNLEGVDFVVANTDAQALAQARTDRRIQLGAETTHGLGSGARPDIGRAAAEESYDAIATEMKGSHMCFITAGMGGGTGTGAAPVVARCARDLGILTVGVVTKPFQFEGAHRMRLAEGGIDELGQYVDTLIIIPNQNLFRVANEKTTFADAFKMADDVLYAGVRSVTDLMMMPGLINLDFADVRTVMMDMGRAMMGTGEASGENRAIEAAEAAIANPLLEETSMRGARGVLINITGGNDLTLYEVDEAANRIREEVRCEEANVIFGSSLDAGLDGRMRVSVVATGIDAVAQTQPRDGSGQVSGGFGLGLASAAQEHAGGKPAVTAAVPPVARPTRAEPGARPAQPVASEVLDDTAADMTADGLLDPAAVLDGETRSAQPAPARPAPASAHPAAPARPTAAPARPVARQAAPPTVPSQPAAAGARAFIPEPAATPGAPRMDPAAARGLQVPQPQPHPGAGLTAPAQGYAAPQSVGQTALAAQPHIQNPAQPQAQPQAHQPARPVQPHPQPHPTGRAAPRGDQPGLRVTAGGRDQAGHGHGRGHEHDDGHGQGRGERLSLFQRMTGFRRAVVGDDHRGDHRADQRRDDRRDSWAEDRQGGHRDAAAEDGGPMTVNPDDRPVASHSEDHLEIPAFLRRQAN